MSELLSDCCHSDFRGEIIWTRPWIGAQGREREERIIVNICRKCGRECNVEVQSIIEPHWNSGTA
jgi:hypothetical protein